MKAKQAKGTIEAIYPLTFLQQTLLLNGLQKNKDKAFLHVKCALSGELDFQAFQDSWADVIERHESLRASVHWEDIKKPVVVVKTGVELPLTFHDWTQVTEETQDEMIEKLIRDDKALGLELSSPPVFRICLVKLAEDKHFILWSCHHILADGWSASIVLRDFFAIYDARCRKAETSLKTIPSHRSYLDWVKGQDRSSAKSLFKNLMKGLERPTIVADIQSRKQNEGSKALSIVLSESETRALRTIGKENRITLNTLLQTIWAILLSAYCGHRDVAYGVTVSGRSVDFENVELIADMMMNVLPFRFQLNPEYSFSNCLKALHARQSELRQYEYISIDDILEWVGLANDRSVFDSLFVFQNVPIENLRGGSLYVGDLSSELISSYPLTCAVLVKNGIEFDFKYRPDQITDEAAGWFAENLQLLINGLVSDPNGSIADLISNLVESPVREKRVTGLSNNPILPSQDYVPPRNEIELELARIWENILDRQPIGVTSDFFEIGGTSIAAVRLFAIIEKRFNRSIQPINLLQNRTIEKVSKLITQESEDEILSLIVPLRASGSKQPLFCLHAGGGQVFFYDNLAKRLGDDQPVYGIQRPGNDDYDKATQEIETIAARYLEEIRQVQPKGPYAVLGYCFSAPVCYEIGNQLRAAGERISLMAIIDSTPSPMYFSKRTVVEKLARFRKLAHSNDWSFIEDIIDRRLIRPIKRFYVYMTGDQPTRHRMDIVQTTNQTFEKYNWKPSPQKVTIFATSDRQERRTLEFMEEEWSKLALGGVDSIVIPGTHDKIFEEPIVKDLAAQLTKFLDKSTKKHEV